MNRLMTTVALAVLLVSQILVLPARSDTTKPAAHKKVTKTPSRSKGTKNIKSTRRRQGQPSKGKGHPSKGSLGGAPKAGWNINKGPVMTH